jgi:hypothetical protein
MAIIPTEIAPTNNAIGASSHQESLLGAISSDREARPWGNMNGWGGGDGKVF